MGSASILAFIYSILAIWAAEMSTYNLADSSFNNFYIID